MKIESNLFSSATVWSQSTSWSNVTLEYIEKLFGIKTDQQYNKTPKNNWQTIDKQLTNNWQTIHIHPK